MKRAVSVSEEWLPTFDVVTDGVAVLDAGGITLRCNAALCRWAGRSQHLLVGIPVSRLIPDLGATPSDIVDAVLKRRERTVAEVAGAERLIRVVADPVLDRDGRVDRVVLVVTDMTEHQRLEDEQRRGAEHLAELSRRKDEFLGMLAHELRNPLHAIAAANSLMDLVGAQDDRNVRLRGTIRRQTGVLARLVDDLLEVSRVTRGTVRLQQELHDLVAIVQSAADNARPTIEARQQTLDLRLPSAPLPMRADALRLEQVFVNLLQNASKYSERGKRVTLECQRVAAGGPPRGMVRVTDEGVGIPRDKLDAIFDLFFQVDQTLARSLGGVGLGLTIARRLVELHGGTIRAASAGVGYGADFIGELPLSAEAVAATAPQSTPSTHPADSESLTTDAAPLTVLVIEDNRDARETLKAWLEELGHRVFEAERGPDGLELARAIRPDVALVDIGLPGLDGYGVAKGLRESQECRNTLLVAITGYGRREDSARARDAGFDLHLVKPIQPEQLARAIRTPKRDSIESPSR
jgi:PAS domain S-box-containing protein